MLLSRSPLSPGPKSRIPFDLHASDVPPAFILSQDQTLLEFRVSCGRAAGSKFVMVRPAPNPCFQGSADETSHPVPAYCGRTIRLAEAKPVVNSHSNYTARFAVPLLPRFSSRDRSFGTAAGATFSDRSPARTPAPPASPTASASTAFSSAGTSCSATTGGDSRRLLPSAAGANEQSQ